MIVADEPKRILTSGEMEEVSFSVDTESLQHLFDVLRNNIYSDKILAVMREYSTNAYDAHIEGGQPLRPIEVTLPNALNPTFKVRDFGPGLSPDDIRDIYTRYGKSTKRGSNTMVGQLGLGSKSAFAYSSNFSITSFYNGTKTVYEAFIDETKVGKVNKMWEEPTDEENGVEIGIPVKKEDINSFGIKARTFYQFFSPRPKFSGDAEIATVLAKRDNLPLLMGGADWSLYSGNGGAKAVMGNISYPIDAKIFDGKDEQIYQRMVSQSDMVIQFPIGDVRMTASREALDYNDFTKAAIKSKIKAIADEIKKDYTAQLAAAATRWEARVLFGKIHSSSAYWLRELLDVGQIMFQGKPLASREIDNNVIKNLEKQGITFKTYGSNQFGSNSALRGDAPWTIVPSDDIQIVVNKGDFVAKEYTSRVRGAWKDRDEKKGYKSVLVIIAQTPAAYQMLLSHEDFKGIQAESLKDATPFYPNKVTTAGGAGVPTKQSSRCFVYNQKGGYHYASSDNWDIATVDPEKDAGVYIGIYAYEPSDGERKWMRNNPTLNNFNRILEALKAAGITPPKTIYGFKGNVKKIGAKMVPFEKWLTAAIKDYITTHKIEREFSHLSELSNEDNFYVGILSVLPELLPSTPLADYLEAIKECQDAQNGAKAQLVKKIETLLNYVDCAVDKPVRVAQDLTTLREAVEAAYPMMKTIKAHIGTYYMKNAMSEFVQYANLIGKYHQKPSPTKP